MEQIHMDISIQPFQNSYEPQAFGPAMWFTLHNGASAYPEKPSLVVQNSMMQFLSNLHFMIPCLECREHYFQYVRNTDLAAATRNREALFTYIVDMHNNVNFRIGKPTMSLETAKQVYGFYRPRGSIIRITYDTRRR